MDVSLYISMGDWEKALDTVDSAIVNLEGISGIPMKLSEIESIRVFPDVGSTVPRFEVVSSESDGMGVDGAGECADRGFFELDLGVSARNAKPAKRL